MSRKRISRNVPCPCGSGKKYKHCCYHKGFEWQEDDGGNIHKSIPMSSEVSDDKTTTKIAAAVIVSENGEPVLERWMGTDVTTNPKVQQELQEFFQRHGVASVAMSQGNMGCPHEEREDFPAGENCPFCPFWRGKQGSNRRE